MRLIRPLVCEFLGTALLLAAVVGSGILAHKLDMGNLALSVFFVAIATGGSLAAGILALGHISAHFNPIVTLAEALRGEFPWRHVIVYWLAQIAGEITGVILANLMFNIPAVCISETARSGAGQWLAEFVSTFGLLGIILGCSRSNPSILPIAVPFYIVGAIMFTSSTCFANPAVTVARIFTNTLCGISPDCVLAFIAWQVVACFAAVAVFSWLFKQIDDADGTAGKQSSTSHREDSAKELASSGRL